jgi:hypothetical protein
MALCFPPSFSSYKVHLQNTFFQFVIQCYTKFVIGGICISAITYPSLLYCESFQTAVCLKEHISESL